ncbi:MAG: pyridoxamine 5'-phosphate oxidase family protein [Deltaproteobacteria bacterium]|nr:pyridoxamine 5'-phosphate oxidase family protein [Deltaproteobacteria bacterium]
MADDLLDKIRPEVVDRWGDPAKHPETTMTAAAIAELLATAGELYLSHHTSDDFPMVTVHFFCVLDGVVWTTTVRGRAKEKAFRRDPRTCLCVSNGDLTMSKTAGVAIKARAQLVEDRDAVRRVCQAQVEKYFPGDRKRQQTFMAALDTPNRVAVRFEPIKVISWDLRRSMRRQPGAPAAQG